MSTPTTPPAEEFPSSVHVTSYPKIIYLWPTWVASWIIWISGIITGSSAFIVAPLSWVNWTWIFILTFNLFVVAFEFAAGKFLIILLLIFGLIGVSISGILPLPALPQIEISNMFYLIISMVFTIIFGLLWFSRRFNYLEISHQQISYHVGILADERRYPAPSIHFEKITDDVFERIMPPFCAKLIMRTEKGEIAEIMNCVPRINKRLRDIKKILDYLQVKQF